MEGQLSNVKLFVGGLAWKLRGIDLKEAFEKCGEVVFARVILEKETGRSKGFGFVEFANPEDAQKAVDEMDGAEVEGREIRVNFATEKPQESSVSIDGEGI